MISFSVDDGCDSDLRLALLLEKYGQKMTIYLPVEWQRLAYENGYRPLSFAGVQNLLSRGHKLGSHTISHPHLTKIISNEELESEIADSKSILEHMFDIYINSFCPPRGYTNDKIDEIIYQNYSERRLTKDYGLVHIHPDSGANDNEPWQARIDQNTTELWGHSHEFDRFNMWEEIEEWLKQITNQ